VAAGTGGFESHLLGEIDLYASDLAHAVLVDLGERPVDPHAGRSEGFSKPSPPLIYIGSPWILCLDNRAARTPRWTGLHGERRAGHDEQDPAAQERRARAVLRQRGDARPLALKRARVDSRRVERQR